jgi:hypothetical protein
MNDDIKKYITEKVNKVLKDRLGNTMIGNVNDYPSILWRPNNYRIRIEFNAKHFKEHYLTLLKKSHKKRISYGTLKVSNYGTKFTKKGIDITLMIDIPKETNIGKITAIYKNKGFWYKVLITNLDEFSYYIDNKVEEIKQKLFNEIKTTLKQYRYRGLIFFNQAKWTRHEDAIKGEDFIDNLDQSMIIHDTYFKKVYPDNIEFKNPAFVKTYIKNRVIEDLAPEIKNELALIRENLTIFPELKKSIDLEIYNKQLHQKVLEDMRDTLKKIQENLDKNAN